AIGDRTERGIDDERGRKHRLEIRFIPTRECPPGIGGFELRCREGLRRSVPILVGAPVEPSKLVFERTAKFNLQPPLARGQRLSDREHASLQRLVKGNRSRVPSA